MGHHERAVATVRSLGLLVLVGGVAGLLSSPACARYTEWTPRSDGGRDSAEDAGASRDAAGGGPDSRTDSLGRSDAGCGPSNCPSGCCDGLGRCLSGSTDTNCGSGGSECQDCTQTNEICLDQECLPPGSCTPRETRECGNCGTSECQSDHTWGPCLGEGECRPGTTEELGNCDRCGTLRKTCSDQCRWNDVECIGQGVCNPGQTEDCTTSCGSTGSRTCSGTCQWSSCTPPAEDCNGVDDDCDGETDEGFRAENVNTTYAVVSGYDADCTGPANSLSCARAIHRYCDARDSCKVSGFGPVETYQGNLAVTCVAQADVLTVTFADLTAVQPGCTSSSNPVGSYCRSAIRRYCGNHGYVSGYGAVDVSGNDVTIVCIRSGAEMDTTYTTLSSYQATCDGVHEAIGMYCNSAIKRYCADQGFVSGFGPVEMRPDDDYIRIACVRE